MDKTGHSAVGHTQHVMHNQNLTIGIRASANTDYGHIHSLRHLFGQGCRFHT